MDLKVRNKLLFYRPNNLDIDCNESGYEIEFKTLWGLKKPADQELPSLTFSFQYNMN